MLNLSPEVIPWHRALRNSDLTALTHYLHHTLDDYDMLQELVRCAWWDGVRHCVASGMNCNRMHNGYRLLEVWHESSMEQEWDYTDELDDMDEKHMKWGLTELIDLGCNPYLCDKFQLHELAYTYYMDKVADKCRRSVLFVVSSKGWMTRDTRFLIAEALWEMRGDWEAWESV